MRRARLAAAAAALLAAAIFAADLSLPLGVAGGVPYVAVILLGWWFGPPRTVFALAAVCSVFTALGYLLSPAGGIAWMVLANRGLALAAIWVTAALIDRAKDTEARVRAARNEAEALAEELHATLATLQEKNESLSENEARYRSLYNDTPVMMHSIDTEGRLLTVSDYWLQVLGYRRDEAIGKHATEFLSEESRRRALETVLPKFYETGNAIDVPYQLVKKSGEVIDVLLSAVMTGAEGSGDRQSLTVIIDVTDRKRAEREIQNLNEDLERRVAERGAELRESEMRLRDAIEALPVGFAIFDRDDRLTLCNDTYRDQVFHHLDSVPLGATFEDILRDKFDSDHYPETGGRRDDWLAERLRSHRNPTGPFEQKHSNGRWYSINERRTDAGGVVVVSSDITERKRLESEVLRQERLATLGRLTATVSHELRNPLGVIRTSAFTVSRGLDGEGTRAHRALERIERSVVRCDRIIDELLDFTRITELELKPTPLNSWLERTLAEQNLPPDVELRRKFDAAAANVTLDRDRFRRAVINVFDNACQAMTDPDTRDRGAKDSVLSVTTQVSEDRVEIVFEDNGPGISADVHPMIFEPLFSTKGFGVGLGLSVVHQIMEQHGGGIEIDSVPDHGARVCLWLPKDRPAD